MGAWDATSFGNDTACDWAYELEGADDLSLISNTLQAVLDTGGDYLDADPAQEAVAAAEVIAWLRGHPKPVDASTEKLAEWVAAHPNKPSQPLIEKALAVLDRIQDDESELQELWENDPGWAASLADLTARLTA